VKGSVSFFSLQVSCAWENMGMKKIKIREFLMTGFELKIIIDVLIESGKVVKIKST
jgi:hypothetical protein